MIQKNFSRTILYVLSLSLAVAIQAAPPLLSPEGKYSEFEKFWINQTGWAPQEEQEDSFQQTSGAAVEAPAIEAFWVGTPQWMGGVNNGFEAFGGSMAKGIDFFGSNIQPNQYVPVEIKFDTNSANWTFVQTFRRSGYKSAGVGTFPGSAWDISDSLNPRRLNLCIVETDAPPIPPPDSMWNPDNSSNGKYEYLFVMNSDYDGTGLTYAGINILTSDPDVLYAWWPRVADGRIFFQTPTASILIKIFIGLNVTAYENEAILGWVNPGDPPAYFKLYWGNSNPPTNLLATFSPTTAGYLHTNLTKNLNYYYQVRSFNGSNVEINNSIVKFGTTTELANLMNIVGHWDGRGNSYGACWGWTDPNTGHEYGLICARNAGVSIIDLDAIPQVEVGFIPGASSGVDVKEVRVWDHYAVVISEFAATKIVDISDPYNPNLLSTIPGGRHCCMVDSHYVYLAGGSAQGLAIWSIANPSSPQLMDQYNPYYYHDYAIHNNTVAAFAIYGQGIDLLDVTNKKNIQLINQFNYPGSGAHNGAFTENGNYLFVGDEIGTEGNWTRTFDLSDPMNVSYIDDLIVPGAQVVHNCYVKGDYLVISHYSEGVRIWNVANPASSFEVGYFDTYPVGGAGYTGCWHNYPYFPSGRIIASDMTYGLFTLTSPLLPPDPPCCVGNRGDLNGDGSFNTDVLDLTFAVDRIFRGGQPVSCDNEGDFNADGTVCNILDLTFIVDRIFRGGAEPTSCPVR